MCYFGELLKFFSMFWGFRSFICPASCASSLSLLFGRGGYSKAVAELRLGDFNAQGLANAAWAFATVATASQQDAQLFAALARVAELRLGDSIVQHLANTA